MVKKILAAGLIATVYASVAMGGNVITTIEQDACRKDPKLDAVFKKACVVAAPEMDHSSAIAALTLLAGGLAVVVGTRSKRLKTQAG